MPDPRFFTAAGPFTLERLAGIAGAELATGADPAAEFADVAPLDTAGPGDVSFLDNKKYVGTFEASRPVPASSIPTWRRGLRPAWRCW